MKDEYLMLRQEILTSMRVVKDYRNWLYTIVIAVIAFVFERENSWLFLLPFIAIIPLYNLAMHQVDSVLRIGAYVYVFLEPSLDIKWETNLYEYDKIYKTQKTLIDPYVVLSLICLILSIVNLNFENIKNPEVWSCIIVQTFLMLYCIWLFSKRHVDYVTTKEKYIEKWNYIKQQNDTHENNEAE
jgi:hypothetical protein